ncbi:Protein OBERON 3 [Cardamine amara subsp. amara]|uniref:OBERON-like protein n=1 Tax=Cardamine amara subsp. amara TaxID=228776 RepID=A0ABD1BQT0_CARAN
MIGDKDISGDGETSRTKPSKPRFDFLNVVRSNNHHLDGQISSKSGKIGNELTLSYLCENREFPGKITDKGKEIAISENWIERDFLNFREIDPKRKIQEEEEEEEEENHNKKSKIETLNLSLGLPDVSLSLTASNGVKRPLQPTTTFSNDFTAATMSYSNSHPFSHNPSCSLTTRNSTDFDCSDQIWFAGEGTNGSVHSRFRPIGDGNPNFLGKQPSTLTDPSFFPSDLPGRPRVDVTLSGDVKLPTLDVSERFLYDVVSKSISSVALMIQGMAEETLESAKEYLRNLIDSSSSSSEKLKNLQKQLEKRYNDLTKETLSKCVKDQLDILVAVRTGLKYFLSGKIRIPMNELVEIFLFLRCRNVNCKSLLPVDDCECKICSSNKGFCSSCMCPVCLKFDSASNTCSWVGCDVCSHWCHASCGIQKNLIKPGLSLKSLRGETEILFHCIGCGHKSEMFGFVKDVFVCCAKKWGYETLVKELVCVAKIFRGSDDAKGKELFRNADEMVKKLESKRISPPDACNFIIRFFNYAESVTELPVSSMTSKEQNVIESSAFVAGKEQQKKQKSSVLTDVNSFDSLESMVRIKEAESRMFQKKADEARREAESFKRVIEMKTEKMEEEYKDKVSRLCLQETEERRRKKLEELKGLENSHCDYKKMKMRMEAEIAGLLKRMEVTRQQYV